jgi:poly(A) polymerase
MIVSSADPASSPDDLFIQQVIDVLAQLDCQPFAVGGMVRDRFLGRCPSDLDIAVTGDVARIAETVSSRLGGKWFLLDEVRGVARLVFQGGGVVRQLDLSCYAGVIEDDLRRRDFTVNAMAVPLSSWARERFQDVIDPFKGRADLKDKRLRMVTPDVFTEDPLRLLRLARVAADYDLVPEPQTMDAARKAAHLLKGVAGERIHDELSAILGLRLSSSGIRLLVSAGVLDELFPSLAETRRVEASGAHQWDVFEHSLRTLEAFEFLTGESGWTPFPVVIRDKSLWLEPLCGYLDDKVGGANSRRSLTKLAALLHDIGKPATLTREESGRLRFLGHAATGAEIAREDLTRLRFGGNEVDLVLTAVLHHLRPFQLANEGHPSSRAVYRFCRDAGETWREVVLLALSDHLATRGSRLDSAEWNAQTQLATYIVSERSRQVDKQKKGRLVDGHVLKSTFSGISGPDIGRALEEIDEAASLGEVRTRADALKLVSETILRDNAANPTTRGVTK